jgi:hypothetical protein
VTDVATALLEALDERALQTLAERLDPNHLVMG